MDVLDQLEATRSGKLSRRAFSRSLLSAGVCVVGLPLLPKVAQAAAADQATIFTWGGYDVPELFGAYKEKHGELPNMATYGGSEEGFTKMRGGYVVDVAHPCNVEIPRWVGSGLFQPLNKEMLSNWDDVIPELYDLPGNVDGDNVYMAPFDWGQTSITYRTDLYDLEGAEESWGMLWNEKYQKRLAMLASGGDAWWCAAIYAGVDFNDVASDEGFAKTAAVLREQRPMIKVYTDDETTLEQALASGEVVAAMTWNSSATTLKSQDVPVKFANPKEGALTWVCGLMVHKDAPKLELAHDIIDSMLSVDTGKYMIAENGYGHANRKAFDLFSDDELAGLGLSRNPNDILDAGKFQVPQGEEFETRMNTEFEKVKAGF